MQQEIHNREVDLKYTIYFPLSQPYISLWPQRPKPQPKPEPDKQSEAVHEKNSAAGDNGQPEDKPSADTRTPSRSHHIWALVEEKMAQGRLQELRDGAPKNKRDVPVHLAEPSGEGVTEAEDRAGAEEDVRWQGRSFEVHSGKDRGRVWVWEGCEGAT